METVAKGDMPWEGYMAGKKASIYCISNTTINRTYIDRTVQPPISAVSHTISSSKSCKMSPKAENYHISDS